MHILWGQTQWYSGLMLALLSEVTTVGARGLFDLPGLNMH